MSLWLDGNAFTALYTAMAFALVIYLFARRPRRRVRVARAIPAEVAQRRAGLHSLPFDKRVR